MKHGFLPELITVFLTAIFLLLGAVPQSQADKVTFYHNDHLGSPLAMTDDTGAVVWRRDYKPFGGEIDPGGETATNTHKYTGKEYDPETGLYYYGARYYDPVIGRFLSVDPAGGKPEMPQTWNRYIYTLNNPYKYVDPDGEEVRGAGNYYSVSVLGANFVIEKQYVLDDKGNYAIAVSKGFGGDTEVLSGSFGRMFSEYNYESIRDMAGESGVTGIGAAQGPAGSLDLITDKGRDIGNEKHFGAGLGFIPVSIHGGKTKTSIEPIARREFYHAISQLPDYMSGPLKRFDQENNIPTPTDLRQGKK